MSTTSPISQCKKKTNIFVLSEMVLAQLPTRKLRSRIAAPNGAVTGTGQPRPCNLTDVSWSVLRWTKWISPRKILPKRRGRGWTKISAVLLAITVNVLVPKSVDRDRSIETRVQSDPASGTAHTHMKNLKLTSCRVFANVFSC